MLDPQLLIGGGAGLIFLQRSLYYLTGVFSIKDYEIEDSVAVYSDVRYHIKWIHDIYVNHTNTNCNVASPKNHGEYLIKIYYKLILIINIVQ